MSTLCVFGLFGPLLAVDGGDCRDLDVDLLQVGLSLKDSDGATLGLKDSSHSHHTVSKEVKEVKEATETKSAKHCPPMYPHCGQLKPICDDHSKNLLRLGTARPGETRDLLMDLTHVLAKGNGSHGSGSKVQVLVMAMFQQGAYTDDLGYIAERAAPEEDTESTLLELALSEDGDMVEVYKPIMNIRTSDLQSAYAVKSGLGSTLIATLPRLSCEGQAYRIIVEATSLLGEGFFVVDSASLGSSIYVVDAKEFPKNFDITVDYGPMFPLLRVGYTVLLLPEKPMKPRLNDDRLLYFDTQFLNKGSHQTQKFQKPSEAVDSEVSMIWRYNIDALPNETIRFYVDPSVPKRWRPFFRPLGEISTDFGLSFFSVKKRMQRDCCSTFELQEGH